jgi:hypothetical protein
MAPGWQLSTPISLAEGTRKGGRRNHTIRRADVKAAVRDHGRYRADSNRQDRRCRLSRCFGRFTRSSRHGGHVACKAVPDPGAAIFRLGTISVDGLPERSGVVTERCVRRLRRRPPGQIRRQPRVAVAGKRHWPSRPPAEWRRGDISAPTLCHPCPRLPKMRASSGRDVNEGRPLRPLELGLDRLAGQHVFVAVVQVNGRGCLDHRPDRT